MNPLLALLPAFVFLTVLPLNHTNAIRLTALFVLGLMAMVYAWRQKAPSLPAQIPLALWAGLALLSASWSVNPSFSLAEFKTEVAYGMIAFCGFFVLTRDRKTLDAFLAALLLGVSITLIISVVEIWELRGWVGYEWDWQHGFVSYSTYLATVFPVLLFALVRSWRQSWVKPVLLFALPVFFFVAFATLNRMFWLTLAVSTVAMLALAWRHARKLMQTRRLVISVAAGLGIVALLFVAVTSERVVDPLQKQTKETSTLTHLSNTFTHSERYQIWSYWIGHIQEKPWLGVGFGRDLPQKVYEKPREWFGLMFAHAHNVFLDYALQMGIPGALALLLLFVALGLRFWRISRLSDPDRSLAGAAGIGVLLAVISKNMTDDLFWRTDALLFWSLMGILLGYGLRHKASDSETP